MPPSYYPLIQQAVGASGFEITEVVCGLARGADTLGKQWAHERGIPVAEFPADWESFGKGAGHIRNRQMRDYADAGIGFIWGSSKGSMNMLSQLREAGKPCFVVYEGVI